MSLPRRLRLIVASVVALAMPFALPALASADPAFTPPASTSVAGRPDKVFAGHLDGDGDQDVLVVTRSATDGWSVIAHLGNGDGTFGPGDLVSGGDGYRTAAAGDFDADGDLDVVISASTGTDELLVVVTLGVDAGEVVVETSNTIAVPARVDHLAVADFRGDDGEDIAVSDAAAAVRIYDHDAPSLPDTANPGGDATPVPGPIAGFDHGRDGDMDVLAVATRFGVERVVYYLTDGAGWSGGESGAGGHVKLVTTGDFDADGRQDAAVVVSPQADFFLVSVAGTFLGSSTDDPAALVAGDFDGDRNDEYASLALTAVNRVFEAPVTPAGTFPNISGVLAADAADFDEDGRDDLLIAHEDRFETRLSRTNDYPGPALTGPPPFTNDSTPSVGVAAAGPGAERRCRLDGGSWLPCGAIGPLDDGLHTFDLQERAAGLTFWSQSSSVSFTVDTAAPDAPQLTLTPDALSRARRFEFTGETDATFECAIDGGAYAACTSPYEPALADGDRTVRVRTVDRAGNPSQPAEHSFTLDTTAPDAPQFTVTPDAVSRLRRFEFTGEADATFECLVDGNPFAACTSPFEPALADGDHTIMVRQTDAIDNVSAVAVHSFTLDTSAPDAPQLTLTPAAVSRAARFEFSGEAAARFECQVDGDPFAACTSPFEPALADGDHTVTVRQLDAADNVSAGAAHTFTLDTTAPVAPTLLAGPPASSTDRHARFEFAGEPGAAFECALDDGGFEPCTSAAEVTGLALGDHRFAIRQTDLAGNAGPAHETKFTVTAPPRADPPTAPPPSAGTPAQPAPPAARPAPRPRRATVVVPGHQVVAGRGLTVGCRLDRGRLKSCSVTAHARSGGRAVRVGAGSSGSDGVVRVKLTPQGRRFVNRLGGVAVRLRLRATAVDGTVVTGSLRLRLLPQRVLAVPADGLFASDEATLLPAGRRYVRGIARQLDGAARVSCVGHTDSRGTAAHNRRLGLARARAVCSLLGAGRVGAGLHASSRGETQPRAGNRTPRGRSLNRRVELIVRYREGG